MFMSRRPRRWRGVRLTQMWIVALGLDIGGAICFFGKVKFT
jgi:hypothetical protein